MNVKETERKLIRGCEESWRVCGDTNNSQSTMDNVKDSSLYPINRKQQLKGYLWRLTRDLHSGYSKGWGSLVKKPTE